jgi:hypothetical protein
LISVCALRWLEFPCRDWLKRGLPRRPKAAEEPAGLPSEPKPTFIR